MGNFPLGFDGNPIGFRLLLHVYLNHRKGF